MRLSNCENIRSFVSKSMIKNVVDRSGGFRLRCLFEDIVLSEEVLLERWSKSNDLPLSEKDFYFCWKLIAEGHVDRKGERLTQHIYTDGNIIITKYTYRRYERTVHETTLGYQFEVINSKYLQYIKDIDEVESEKVKKDIENHKAPLGKWMQYDDIEKWNIK